MVETHIPMLADDAEPSVVAALAYRDSTPHLNRFGIAIRATQAAGRGLFATQAIQAGEVIEISPVLLFPPREYEVHGSQTQLDGYTFVWLRTPSGPVMALALGLGSLFNHARTPNVNYTLDRAHQCIRYTTTKPVQVGEQLCISYGPGRMWWEPPAPHREEEEEDPMRLLANGYTSDDEQEDDSFWRITADTDPLTVPISLIEAYTLRIEPRTSSSAVKALHRLKIRAPRHLRQFRSQNGTMQMLLCLSSECTEDELRSKLSGESDVFGNQPRVERTEVPSGLAPCKLRVQEWAARWPCVISTDTAGLVDRKADQESWSSERTEWAVMHLERVVALASENEVTVAAHVTRPFSTAPEAGEPFEIDGIDRRKQLRNPLKHAVVDAIANVAQRRAEDRQAGNVSDYLLTGLALFTTHEPCVYCCMALVHSRVKKVYFLLPSPGRGGCCGARLPKPCDRAQDGGVYAIQEQKGLNHAYEVWRYTGGRINLQKLAKKLDIGTLDP